MVRLEWKHTFYKPQSTTYHVHFGPEIIEMIALQNVNFWIGPENGVVGKYNTNLKLSFSCLDYLKDLPIEF